MFLYKKRRLEQKDRHNREDATIREKMATYEPRERPGKGLFSQTSEGTNPVDILI